MVSKYSYTDRIEKIRREERDGMRQRIADLEAALRDALDYIDDPTQDVPGATLIVLAGRSLLDQKSDSK
jgi:hypothetical protein